MRVRSAFKIILVVAVFGVLAVGAVGCKRSEEKASSLKLSAEGRPVPASNGELPETSSTADPKSPTTETAAGDTGTSAGGSSASGGGSTSGGGSGSDGSGGSSAPVITRDIKVLWWNDTASNAPKGCEIVFAGNSFKPDYTAKKDSGSIGPCPVGKVLKLEVYPDGRAAGAKPIVVDFTVTKDMEPNSDVDAIHVEISDTRVKVLGNAVRNFQQSYAR